MKRNLYPLYEQADLFHLMPLLIESGIPHLESLELCKREFPNYDPEFSEIIATLNEGEEEDRVLASIDLDLYMESLESTLSDDFIRLSANLSSYKRSFHPNFVALFTIGITQGNLEILISDLGKKILGKIPHKIPEGFKWSNEVLFYKNLGESCVKDRKLIYALKEEKVANLEYPSKEIFKGLVSIVESNDTLSNAMLIYPKAFPSYQQKIVENAEACGLMDFLLPKLSDYLRMRESLRQNYSPA